MVKSYLAGLSVLLAVLFVWAVLLQLKIFSQSMAIILWLSPGVAAFAAAYLAPSSKFLLGASMGLPAAVLAVAFNSISQLAGIAVDFPGAEGGLVLFVIILVGATVIASVGALAGFLLTRKSG